MTFNEKYPDLEIGEEAPPPDGVFMALPSVPCSECGTPTVWRDLDAEGNPVCSEECMGVWWQGFATAYNRAYAGFPRGS